MHKSIAVVLVTAAAAVVLASLTACGSTDPERSYEEATIDYRSDAGRFALQYPVLEYHLTDDPEAIGDLYWTRGSMAAIALTQRGEGVEAEDLEGAWWTLSAYRWPTPEDQAAEILMPQYRDSGCFTKVSKMDKLFKRLMTDSHQIPMEDARVDGLPGYKVERTGALDGVAGGFRVQGFYNEKRMYLVVLWWPKDRQDETLPQVDGIMGSLRVD